MNVPAVSLQCMLTAVPAGIAAVTGCGSIFNTQCCNSVLGSSGNEMTSSEMLAYFSWSYFKNSLN